MEEENKKEDSKEKELEKEVKKVTEKKYDSLIDQARNEYKLCVDHQSDRKKEDLLRLKLYNNQKRDKSAIGDNSMFIYHQTVLASLYVDKLNVEYIPRSSADVDAIENFNKLALYDYDAMDKDITDYHWDWDTLFFGKGLLDMHQFIRDPDKGIYMNVPSIIDPIAFWRDPLAISFNGINALREGAANFFGSEITMSRMEMKNNINFFDLDFRSIKTCDTTRTIVTDGKEERDNAQGFNGGVATRKLMGDNSNYNLIRWNTYWKGKRVRLWVTGDFKTPVGFQELTRDYWQCIDRPLYPHSHDWRGTSIPDLTEDKQRARAIAQNLGLDIMKSDLMPTYIYDPDKITNKKDLGFGFNKFIQAKNSAADPRAAIQPINKSAINSNILNFIYESLDVSAQKATATPEIKQGVLNDRSRPLGETNLAATSSDDRYSLSQKIFMWSEKDFWEMVFDGYVENFDNDIDEKVLTLTSIFGPKWRPIKYKDIKAKQNPLIKIESKILSRAKQVEELNMFDGNIKLVLQTPGANMRYAVKERLRLSGMDKEKIDVLLPPTVDERVAEEQNRLLNENKTVPVLTEDDHMVHLIIHNKALDTKATQAHIKTHEEALSIKKKQPDLFPKDSNEQMMEMMNQNGNSALGKTTQTNALNGQLKGTSPSNVS